jgi:hypothetical protein
MKKMSLKKLSLSRETLLALDGLPLQQVAGGLTAKDDCTATYCCSGIDTCNCSGTGGGSRLC